MSAIPTEAPQPRPFRLPLVWRLFFGVLSLLVVYGLFIIGIMGAIWFIAGAEDVVLWLDRMQGAVTPTSTILLLSTFLGLILGTYVAQHFWHRERLRDVLGLISAVPWDFSRAAVVTLVIYSLGLAVWTMSHTALPNQPFGLWLNFLPIALLGLLVQTGAEEIVFRGYLQRHLAARFKSPVVWLILPSVLFGLVHYDPASAGENVWLVVLAATIFGLCAADLTARTGSIGAAWGLHFANNLLAISFLATDGTITGLSLYLTPYTADEIPQSLLLIDMGITIATWLACRVIVPARAKPDAI